MEEKPKINGGDVLVKCLLEEGIKYMFGIIGGQFLNMFDAIYQWGRDRGIDTVMFRHEQGAAHAADAWARVSNKPGVCFGTVGPGATDLVPGIGAAWSDNIPVIAIVPQVNSKYDDTFTLQGNLDQITLFKPITKYQRSIRDLAKIPDAVHKVFRAATGGRPGPALLEIYEDAFLEEEKEENVKILPKEMYRPFGMPAIDNKLIKESIRLLISAEKPLILSGGGVSRSEAWNELKEFAEYLQIPVITSVMGIGTISNSSNCLIDSTIQGFGKEVSYKADVVLALGCKFSFTMGHGDEPFFVNSQKLIQVDIDPNIIGRAKPITLGIIGDCKLYLQKLLEEAKKLEPIEKREWLETLQESRLKFKEKLFKKSLKDKTPILPERIVYETMEFMDEDAILVIDGGDIACYTIEQINLHKPRPPLSTLASIGMGHLGTSIPYAIGAKLAKPDKQVIVIAGDGSFLFNVQDLETAVRLGLKNVIFVVANNNSWGMIKSCQNKYKNKHFIDVDLPDFDFAKCAEGFGCYGEVVTDPNELKSALERARISNKPAVIDVKSAQTMSDGTKLMASMGIL
ncbi:MAG: thiamine pyrophosphate-binding protein [Promethearchaeota archaeon]|nr:MAG: thiamine pyrophosphate-binding protein [Candidatus Lokiarchaeota archaeon]